MKIYTICSHQPVAKCSQLLVFFKFVPCSIPVAARNRWLDVELRMYTYD